MEHSEEREAAYEADRKRRHRRFALLALVVVELVAAGFALWWALAPEQENKVVAVRMEETRSPQVGGVWMEQDTPPEAVGIWMQEEVPSPLTRAVQDWVSQHAGAMAWLDSSRASIRIGWKKSLGAHLLAEIVLVPADRFSSPREDISGDELRRLWLGSSASASSVSHLFVSPQTAVLLDVLLGPRGADSFAVVAPAEELPDRVWAEQGSLGVVPFDQLEPSLKVLTVDRRQALDRDLDLDRYPLVARIWTDGPSTWQEALTSEIRNRGLDSNRHLDRLTVVDMTGVTALTRHLALEMERRRDPAWPARRLADLLSAADLTHVSNEVSFVPDCQPDAEMVAFCSPPAYLETLRLIGADVIELTGNHNLDFGPQYALYSLDLYAQEGMHAFGGGRDVAQAQRPLVVPDHGNRLAFLGFNAFGPSYAWATGDGPGAAPFSLETLQAGVAEARSQADVVVVTMQYTEVYSTSPLGEQVNDFRAAIDAGADMVSGSQAHQPQAMEFYHGKPILYGLGNLFFDQTWSDATSQSLIARCFVYAGHLIDLQLIPTVLDRAYQPVAAEGDTRDSILEEVFSASGWQ
jgi:hypothetical protein